MKTKNVKQHDGVRVIRLGASILSAAVLSACASYAGIHSDRQMAAPTQYATSQSLPAGGGHWPSANWIDQFGDAQLKSLIAEALKDNPSVEQARTRVAAAEAFSDTEKAATLPRVDGGYSLNREQLSGKATVPPPYAGSWQTENNVFVKASYDLDAWGKRREALNAVVSQTEASKADAEAVKLTLGSAIARNYNQLARLYALRDIALQEAQRRAQIELITSGRIRSGLDTEVERKSAQAELATSRVGVAALDGNILASRYQLAALLGAGPDRGLTILRPTMGVGDEIRLPDNLPADLVSRRPDLVAARWRVDAVTHQVKEAKAAFYPDINLSAMIGFDSFGFGNFLSAAARTASIGPAIHLPIFDAGALRAQLKGRYADFEYAVATYNQTLIGALSSVATELAEIRSSDAQLIQADAALQAARQADQLATIQYRAGLTNQLTVLIADTRALNSEQTVANLKMNRRDQQIELATALGGGYVDTDINTGAEVAAQLNHAVAR